jgi:hypothetical protein
MNSHDLFSNQVKKHFAFLCLEFGFRIVREVALMDSACIEYRTDQVFVRILKVPPDFEPYFVVGRIATSGSSESTVYDWVDIGALNSCRDWKWHSDDNEPFKGRIRELARLLRECGSAALRAEPTVFDEMARRQAIGRREHLREETDFALRKKGENAWKNRDYSVVVKCYEFLRDHLSELERKRLAYAMKRTNDDQVTNKRSGGMPPPL